MNTVFSVNQVRQDKTGLLIRRKRHIVLAIGKIDVLVFRLVFLRILLCILTLKLVISLLSVIISRRYIPTGFVFLMPWHCNGPRDSVCYLKHYKIVE